MEIKQIFREIKLNAFGIGDVPMIPKHVTEQFNNLRVQISELNVDLYFYSHRYKYKEIEFIYDNKYKKLHIDSPQLIKIQDINNLNIGNSKLLLKWLFEGNYGREVSEVCTEHFHLKKTQNIDHLEIINV